MAACGRPTYGAAMTKKVIDAEFEVVGKPKPRVELPRWFKALMLGACTVLILATALYQSHQRHGPTDPQAAAGVTAEPPGPTAR